MQLCLVMQLMALGSLSDLLNNRMYPLHGERVLQFLQNITQGMAFLHSASPPILHRDLASRNVLVDQYFNAKISDIQLSSVPARSRTSLSKNESPGPNSSQSILRAPECGSGTYDFMSDVYSFGLIVYECLTRTSLFDSIDLSTDVSLQSATQLPDPPGCSLEVVMLMRDCLVAEPKRRPPFQELNRRLSALHVDQMTSEVFAGDASRTPSGINFSDTISDQHSVIARSGHRGSDHIVHNLFPPHVVEALISGKTLPPEPKAMVTMFFSDIVGFTTLSSTLDADKVSNMLNRWFDALDSLADKFGIYKLETIGDAFLCATNVVAEQVDHAARMAHFSLSALEVSQHTLIDQDDTSLGTLQIRIGINSGPCMATVIGRRNPKYTLFGDTVNVASRMESSSMPSRIQCSQSTADLIRAQDTTICLLQRGPVNIKGKGTMMTYWIETAERAAALLKKEFTESMRRRSLYDKTQISAIGPTQLRYEVSCDMFASPDWVI